MVDSGRHRGDAKIARQWFEKGRGSPSMGSKATRFIGEAAVLLAENDLEAAQIRIDQGLAALGNTLNAGLALVQQEQLEDIANQIQYRSTLTV